jgi:hypothetical protein
VVVAGLDQRRLSTRQPDERLDLVGIGIGADQHRGRQLGQFARRRGATEAVARDVREPAPEHLRDEQRLRQRVGADDMRRPPTPRR